MRTIQGTFIRFTSLALMAAAGTVAGSVHADQAVFGATPKVNYTITSPTVAQCSLSNQGYKPGTPKNVVMMGQLPAACGNVLGRHMQDRAKTDASKVTTMFRPDSSAWPANLATTTPANLRQGLLDAFVQSDVRLKQNTDGSFGGTMLSMSTAVGQSVIKNLGSQLAYQYNAHPDWTARGSKIGPDVPTVADNPCGEWVWKGYYDYSRFEDAAVACGTDDECVYQVAFAQDAPTKIAYRSHQLRGQGDGQQMSGILTPIPLMQGFVTKNPFFGVSPAFLIDQQAGLLEDFQQFDVRCASLLVGGSMELQAGPKNYACASHFRFRDPSSKYYIDSANSTAAQKTAALNQKIAAVRTLLAKKAGYLMAPTPLHIKLFPQAERFQSEWHFHEAMHARQKPTNGQKGQPLPTAERNAIDERTKTLLDLIERYTILTSAKAFGNGVREAEVGLRNPVDEALDRIVLPGPDGVREVVVDPLVRQSVVSSMRGDLVAPSNSLQLESAGGVVTTQVAVPLWLTTGTTSTTPMSGTLDSVPTGTTSLVGVERDYGKATDVTTASVAGSFTCPNPAAETDALKPIYDRAREAQKVQEQIVALLLDEYDRGEHGCLSESGYNCDWSPSLFASRFMGQYAAEREDRFQYCVLMTGGNTLNNPDPLFAVPTSKRTMTTFGSHLQSVQGVLKAQLDGLPYVHKGGADHRVGENVTATKEIGDASWFGAGYEYTAGWSLVPEFRAGAGDYDTACGLGAEANATFDAHVSVLGKQVSLLHVQGRGAAAGGAGGYDVGMEFLDQAFEPVKGSERFHQVEADSMTTNRTSATVVVVVVPVTFQAYGELEYGYEIETGAYSKSGCAVANGKPELGMTFRVQPFAKVNAVASAAVGVSGAQAGVRGRIALLDTKLPIEARLEVKPDPAVPSSLKLFPTARADFNASTLSGRMSVFAEVGYSPFDYEAEKTIFSWKGVGDSVPLWLLESDPIQVSAFYNRGWEDWKALNISHQQP